MSSKFLTANKRFCVVAPLPTVTQQNDQLSRPFSAAHHSGHSTRILIIRSHECNHG